MKRTFYEKQQIQLERLRVKSYHLTEKILVVQSKWDKLRAERNAIALEILKALETRPEVKKE